MKDERNLNVEETFSLYKEIVDVINKRELTVGDVLNVLAANVGDIITIAFSSEKTEDKEEFFSCIISGFSRTVKAYIDIENNVNNPKIYSNVNKNSVH